MAEDFTRCEEEIVKRLPKNIARIAKIPPTDKKKNKQKTGTYIDQ